ncbi:hypothetical protein C0991_010679 [Blastosporella zonata]|nr:hypothetical protein C0991_010679 [Blastosporella zonata]
MFHVIEPYEADTFFTHGARELQYDSYSESHYYLVPYSGGYVIRQDFGNKKNKGKAREKNLPHDMQITGQSMWHSLSQRHHVTLENELIDSEVMFVIEGSEAKLLDLWSTLRGRLGVAVGNIQQRWDGGML